jgi:hypothetical protein
LRLLEDVENNLRELKMKSWRQKENNKRRLGVCVSGVRILRGPWSQAVSGVSGAMRKEIHGQDWRIA